MVMLKDDDRFDEFCCLYADHGARRGLVLVAEELGRVGPMIALLRKEEFEVAIESAIRALETDTRCGAMEHMAATVGPDLESLLVRLVSRLDNQEVAQHIQPLVKWFPRVALQLQKIRS